MSLSHPRLATAKKLVYFEKEENFNDSLQHLSPELGNSARHHPQEIEINKLTHNRL